MTTENQNPDGAGNQGQPNSGDQGQPNNPQPGQQNQGDPNGAGQPDNGNPPADPKGDGQQGQGGDDNSGDNQQPQEYSDFELPEGVTVDEKLLESVTPLMQELGINQEGAQKLVSAYANHVQEFNQAQQDAHAEQVEGWEKELRNDKDLGGDNFEENMSIARKAIDEFGSPEFAQLLDQTGLGNHPEMARLLHKVGKLIQEDSPGGGNQPGQQEQDAKSILFPNLK